MYKHTQIGWWMIIILGSVMLILYSSTISRPADSFAYVILTLALIMFAKLTVTIDDEYIRLVFGLIGFPRRKFKLRDIESCRPVKKFMIGLSIGIHYGISDSLYNVSGRRA
ncbi:MAG: hypothetical protein ACM3X9_08435, partial [Bacillota bacterium]